MWQRKASFCTTLLGAAISFLLSPAWIACALTAEEVEQIAQKVVVHIDIDKKPSGSGVILYKQGSEYYVLTNWHVIQSRASKYCQSISDSQTSSNPNLDPYRYSVTTKFDRQNYNYSVNKIVQLRGADLAIVTFISKTTQYPTAEISDSNSNVLKEGSTIYYAGFPAEQTISKGEYRFSGAKSVTGLLDSEHTTNGYQLIINGEAFPGMSGSPIFDQDGQLVGVYGCGDREENTQTISLYAIPIDTAKKLFSQANLRLNSTYAKSYTTRGVFRSQRKDDQGALDDYNKAIQNDPRYALAYYNRGLLFARTKKYESALSDLSEAIRLNPTDHDAFANRGATYLALKKMEQAIKDLSEATRLNPDYAKAYFNRGIAYFYQNDTQKARSDFQKAAELFHEQGEKELSNQAIEWMRILQ